MRSEGKSGTVLAKLTKAVTSRTVSTYDLLLGKRPGGGGRLLDRGGRGGGAGHDVTSCVTRGGRTVVSEQAGWPEPEAAGGAKGTAESADPWDGTGVTGPIGRSSLSTFASVGGEEESSNGRVCHPAAKIVHTNTEAHRASGLWKCARACLTRS